MAIKVALDNISSQTQTSATTHSCVLYTDSLSSVKSLMYSRSGSRPALLSEILSLYRHTPAQITIVWVPSHIGIHGNEMADNLANMAARQNQIDVTLKYELSDIYNQLRDYIDTRWQKSWDLSTQFYKAIQPTINRQLKFPDPNRSKERFYLRIRMGRAYLNKFLQKIKKHSTGLCDSCGVPETTEHFLVNCKEPFTAKIRTWCSSYNLNCTVNSILNSEPILSHIHAECTRDI